MTPAFIVLFLIFLVPSWMLGLSNEHKKGWVETSQQRAIVGGTVWAAWCAFVCAAIFFT